MNHAGTSTDDLLIGTTLAGRYRIVERIGAGAMGAVYRATQTELGRSVALKILRRDVAWAGDTIQRFRREAQAMSALAHPNTVRVFDFGATQDGLLFLAMELLQGESAAERLMRAEPVETEEAIAIAQQVLHSIGEAHAKGIVHRDLKPDNVFLARVDGRATPMVKVLDFGIAKAIEGERKIDQFETLDGTVFGTPRYMSPEQAAGRALDPRTDLYSVGILLYELLSGEPPFVDADAVVVMAKHIREQPAPLSRTASQRMIPRSLEAAVSRALQKDPDKRFQTANELDRTLAACLVDVERLQNAPVARISHTVVTQVSRASVEQRVLAFVAFGVFTILGGWWFWERSQAEASSKSPAVEVTVPGEPSRAATVPLPSHAAPSANEQPPAAVVQATPTPADLPQEPVRAATADDTSVTTDATGPAQAAERARPARRKRSRPAAATRSPAPARAPVATPAPRPGSPYEKF